MAASIEACSERLKALLARRVPSWGRKRTLEKRREEIKDREPSDLRTRTVQYQKQHRHSGAYQICSFTRLLRISISRDLNSAPIVDVNVRSNRPSLRWTERRWFR